MSYCRWSTDNFKCDVYAYESQSGFEIHVAARRVVGDVPPLANILEVSTDEFMKSYNAHHEFLETAERLNIGLEYDGKSFTCDTLEEFLEKLKEIKSKGYNVPDSVFEEVAQEMADLTGVE